MAGRPRKNPLFTNPFFATLVVVSVLFVLTTLAYLAAPAVINPRPEPQGEASRSFALWLDRNGSFILGVEFVIMLAMGVLAMLTDDWFARGRAPAAKGPRADGPNSKAAS